MNMFSGYDVVGVGSNGFYPNATSEMTWHAPAFSTYIMNSDELTDKLIADFCAAIDRGEDPNDVKYSIFSAYNASTDDLTDYDKNRLKEAVELYMEAYND